MEDATDLIDQTVLISLESYEGLEFTGIEGEAPFFCKVAAVDEIGIWIENRNFVTVELRDSKGKYIPEAKREQVKNTVNILMPWRNVKTVIRFPDRDPETLAREVLGSFEEGETRIGFIK